MPPPDNAVLFKKQNIHVEYFTHFIEIHLKRPFYCVNLHIYSNALIVTQYLQATIAFSTFDNLVRSFLLILGNNTLLMRARNLNAERFIVSLYLPLSKLTLTDQKDHTENCSAGSVRRAYW